MAEELPTLSELAQLALHLGFVPIPDKGKRPILPNWQNTTKQTALRKVADAERTGQADNIGILTGKPSGIVVVDVDVSKGGLNFWNELVKQHGEPETLTVETPSGGYHYYFKYDDRTSKLRNATAAIKGSGIDLKSDGGQVVFIGSIGPNGKVYRAINGLNLVDDEINKTTVTIASMPDWLFELLQSNQEELNRRYPRKYGF